jgi:hypothetical protein
MTSKSQYENIPTSITDPSELNNILFSDAAKKLNPVIVIDLFRGEKDCEY